MKISSLGIVQIFHYGNYLQADILKLLLSLVEAKDEVVCAAAQCMPLVAQLGGGGKQGNAHKIAWQKQQLALVNVLYLLLNNIFEHIAVPLVSTCDIGFVVCLIVVYS